MKGLYQGLGHIAIYTQDLGESIAFYEKIGGSLRMQDSLPAPGGEKRLALLEFGGFLLEFIQCPEPMPLAEGSIPHFAVYVEDVEDAAAALKAAGVNTFLGKTKTVLPSLFGGLENWFFTGPSGEQVELLKMLS